MPNLLDYVNLFQNFYILGFWILTLICIGLYMLTRQSYSSTQNVSGFNIFQNTYLLVYLLAMAGDWMQGPYVYALYDSYGLSSHDIEILFVAGFGSSMLFGTVVGSFADRYGRRNNCILYAILYGGSCITKHFANFWILMIGRFLGGIATSILYSAFESWLIFEHNKNGFNEDMLNVIFSNAVFGNSLVAIFSGLLAQNLSNSYGYVAPFDGSLVIMIILAVVIATKWCENHGDVKINQKQTFINAYNAIKADRKILYLGLIQSFFEGAMYTFVLEWTPALSQESGDAIPHGYIFAAFMVAVMCGSSIFKILSQKMRVESFMRYVLLVSAFSLTIPIFIPENKLLVFCGFLLFETCVGVFWPALGTLRGSYVPEDTRATIMNIFRIPLNMIVITVLMQNLSMKIIFSFCVTFLLLATRCQCLLFTEAIKEITLSRPHTPDSG